jgi:hypothetical protein
VSIASRLCSATRIACAGSSGSHSSGMGASTESVWVFTSTGSRNGRSATSQADVPVGLVSSPSAALPGHRPVLHRQVVVPSGGTSIGWAWKPRLVHLSTSFLCAALALAQDKVLGGAGVALPPVLVERTRTTPRPLGSCEEYRSEGQPQAPVRARSRSIVSSSQHRLITSQSIGSGLRSSSRRSSPVWSITSRTFLPPRILSPRPHPALLLLELGLDLGVEPGTDAVEGLALLPRLGPCSRTRCIARPLDPGDELPLHGIP